MNIPTWQERVNQAAEYGERLLAFDAAMAEIAELRAALKAQPVQSPKGLFVDMIATQGPEFVAEMAAIDVQPVQEPVLTEAQIAAHGFKASQMMARDQTRFDAGCEVMRYLKQEHAPYYYLHRMSTVLHGNTEGTEASRAPEAALKVEAPTAQPVQEPIGEVKARPAGDMGNLNWPLVVWTDGIFKIPPVGTKLYAAPTQPVLDKLKENDG